MEILKWGSLPKIFSLQSDQDKCDFLESYALTYLQEEIWNEHLVRDLNTFRKFLSVAAQSNGKVINYANIAQDVRLDTKTVQKYFQILEDTLIGFMLEPYHPFLRKREKNNPKFYLFDLGVTRALNLDFALTIGPQSLGFGYRFEHFIIAKIWRLNSYSKKHSNLSFISENDTLEVDLVLSIANQPPILIGIKSHETIQEDYLKSLKYFAKLWPQAQAICLSLDKHHRVFENINCYFWMDGLKKIRDNKLWIAPKLVCFTSGYFRILIVS